MGSKWCTVQYIRRVVVRTTADVDDAAQLLEHDDDQFDTRVTVLHQRAT